MNTRTERISIRITKEDVRMFEQVAGQDGQAVASWMYDNLRELAIKEIYGTGESEGFTATPFEFALFRAVLVILQTVSEDIPDETKFDYAEKAVKRIEDLISGEDPMISFDKPSQA
ncbi:MAG: hypothetical protein GY847_39320 [Proteobacteria bacterium]|nr:hypothetical protein [Pseudomonadota bacterium]